LIYKDFRIRASKKKAHVLTSSLPSYNTLIMVMVKTMLTWKPVREAVNPEGVEKLLLSFRKAVE